MPVGVDDVPASLSSQAAASTTKHIASAMNR
jgi:hypothetical protein